MIITTLSKVLFLFFFGILLPTALSGQNIFKPYLSQDQINKATEVANDSLGGSSNLVGIATSGVIDLTDLGFPVTFDGFNEENGKSIAWGYLFTSTSGTEEIAVAVVQPIIGDALTYTQRDNGFETGPRALDLSGSFSGSDKLVEELKKNEDFQQFKETYPEVSVDNVVLAWDPAFSGLLPESFPTDSPVWAVYYGATVSDSSLACFVSTGTGASHCISGTLLSVGDERGASNYSIHLYPNPILSETRLRIEIRGLDETRYPEALGLYTVHGKQIFSMDSEELSVSTRNGRIEFEVDVRLLPSGQYFCRIVEQGRVQSFSIIVE